MVLYLPKEPTMSDGPDTPARQLAVAQGALDALPDEAKQGLAATVVQALPAAQQQAAVQGVLDALPDEAKQGLAATVVQALPAAQQQAAAQGVLDALPDDQRTQLAETVLGSPDKKTRTILWYIVVSTLTAAVFVFGSMAFVLVYQKKAAEAPLALATTALGGIVGLVATSPGSRTGS
jgi:hypothetical protein